MAVNTIKNDLHDISIALQNIRVSGVNDMRTLLGCIQLIENISNQLDSQNNEPEEQRET